ncbi:MAG: hypothetical protein NTY19_36090 [Planctomycetota bacterium]|nr:hypothetical protein [Planctomycetota bacterium]
MKGMQGLIVAGALGVLGVALNSFYLLDKTRDIASLAFIGIGPNVTIESGQVIKDEHLVAVRIPKAHAENLKDFVYLHSDRGTVVGITATRRYQGGDLLYREHVRTSPPELKLGPGEKLIWIPVSGNSFVPELVDPGDRIEFVVPVYEQRSLAVIPEDGVRTVAAPRVLKTETIGPFRVGSLGTRLASSEVVRGNRIPTSQERLVGIVIDKKNAQELENAQQLQGRVLSREYQDIGVALLEKVRS